MFVTAPAVLALGSAQVPLPEMVRPAVPVMDPLTVRLEPVFVLMMPSEPVP